MIADIPTPSPSFMGNWFFATIAFCSLIGFVIVAISFFATRRDVDKLEASNIKAWEKMEADKLEAAHAIAAVDSKVAGLGATLTAVNNTVNLMNLKLDNLRK
jgi:hypothetical protein